MLRNRKCFYSFFFVNSMGKIHINVHSLAFVGIVFRYFLLHNCRNSYLVSAVPFQKLRSDDITKAAKQAIVFRNETIQIDEHTKHIANTKYNKNTNSRKRTEKRKTRRRKRTGDRVQLVQLFLSIRREKQENRERVA